MKTIEINLKDVIKVEETWIKPQHSVDGYVEGLEWIRDLLKYHMSRGDFLPALKSEASCAGAFSLFGWGFLFP